MDRVPTVGPDPVCPVCAKPILPKSLVFFDHGELHHVRCRADELGLAVLDEFDRASGARERVAKLIEETKQLRERIENREEGRPSEPGETCASIPPGVRSRSCPVTSG